MRDVFVTADYQRLDKGVKRSLRRAIQSLGSLLDELAGSVPDDEAARCLYRWAMFNAVVLSDRLFIGGKNSRAVIMLRRVAFEYAGVMFSRLTNLSR